MGFGIEQWQLVFQYGITFSCVAFASLQALRVIVFIIVYIIRYYVAFQIESMYLSNLNVESMYLSNLNVYNIIW
jgi:hypothetical protein